MKSNLKWVFAVLILTAIALLWSRRSPVDKEIGLSSEQAPDSLPRQNPSMEVTNAKGVRAETGKAAEYEGAESGRMAMAVKQLGDRSSMDGDISLFGTVKDQYGKSITGVKLEIQITRFPEDYRQNVRKIFVSPLSEAEQLKALNLEEQSLEVLSGADGRFSVVGKKGHLLTITRLNKEGYTAALKNRMGFGYGKNLKDGNHGAAEYWNTKSDLVLVMWKEEQAVRLVEYAKNIFYLEQTNTLRRINLFHRDHAKEGEFADLVISRTVLSPGASRSSALFRYVFEVPDGGSQWTLDPVAYKAPETGYSGRLEWESRGHPSGAGEKRKLYIRSRVGRVYASLEITFMDRGMLIKGFVNGDGSSVLAPSESNLIRGGTEILEKDEGTRGAKH